MVKGLRSWSMVVWGMLAASSFYGTLYWRESDNAAVERAQKRMQVLQTQWRDAQQAASPDRPQTADFPRSQQALEAELRAADQARQVRDDVLQLLAVNTVGLNWQGMQLDGQGVWQLQLRADRPQALDLWRAHIRAAGLQGLQWVQMTGPAPGPAGQDAAQTAQTAPAKEALVLTLRAPLGGLSGRAIGIGDGL